MSDVETEIVSPVAMLQAFEGAIEARLSPAKADAVEIDPRLAELFRHTIAKAMDVVDLSAAEVCAQFAALASAGVDLTRPPSIRINGHHGELEAAFKHDGKTPHRVPAFTPPIAESDAHLNNNL